MAILIFKIFSVHLTLDIASNNLMIYLRSRFFSKICHSMLAWIAEWDQSEAHSGTKFPPDPLEPLTFLLKKRFQVKQSFFKIYFSVIWSINTTGHHHPLKQHNEVDFVRRSIHPNINLSGWKWTTRRHCFGIAKLKTNDCLFK